MRRVLILAFLLVVVMFGCSPDGEYSEPSNVWGGMGRKATFCSFASERPQPLIYTRPIERWKVCKDGHQENRDLVKKELISIYERVYPFHKKGASLISVCGNTKSKNFTAVIYNGVAMIRYNPGLVRVYKDNVFPVLAHEVGHIDEMKDKLECSDFIFKNWNNHRNRELSADCHAGRILKIFEKKPETWLSALDSFCGENDTIPSREDREAAFLQGYEKNTCYCDWPINK